MAESKRLSAGYRKAPGKVFVPRQPSVFIRFVSRAAVLFVYLRGGGTERCGWNLALGIPSEESAGELGARGAGVASAHMGNFGFPFVPG